MKSLEAAARGSRVRARGFPHALFFGPPGTGKSMLARAVASRIGASRIGATLIEATGPLVQDAHAVVRLLASLRDGDVLFLDEIHAVPRAALEMLYQALAERRLSLTLHAGLRARTLRFEIPAFTLVAATTQDEDLPDALRSRFGLREPLGYYAASDLAALVGRVARQDNAELCPDAALRIAEHARGTPREALRLLDRVLDETACRDGPVLRGGVGVCDVSGAMLRLGYDREGFGPVEQRYRSLLGRSAEPISLERMAGMLGTTARKLARDIEPFLFRCGVVRLTPRSRMAVRRPRLLEA